MSEKERVLSPGRLVAKRFFRNKLALAGLIILAAMFLFSFVGGLLSPYGESEVFRITQHTLRDYAGAAVNSDFQYTVAEGKEFPSIAGAKFLLATSKGADTFEAKGVTYKLIQCGEDFYRIEALAQEETDQVTEDKMETETIAIASKKIFVTEDPADTLTYEFRYQAETAMNTGITSFEADGIFYDMEYDTKTGSAVFMREDGSVYAYASELSVNALTSSAGLTVEFRKAVETAIAEGADSFVFSGPNRESAEYVVENDNGQYIIRSYRQTQLNDVYASPSREHWLGTDGNGMDILTRLMYGGRISLLIGFVAIFIELVIGVLIGGIAGYFGKWVDSFLMRLVEIFICIPAMPLYIILGSVMDYYQINPKIRIYLLCVILGLLSWPGIARMVRGQILSLREQEFMVATEATGISTYRRIFRHLIPNVIPQLIVIATMGLGDIILMEATLSFLGLGVKYPYASWGNIINAVNDSYVMTNYWHVWIPAGFLILLTVLGFNFVGDGLRDAFDPKMKR